MGILGYLRRVGKINKGLIFFMKVAREVFKGIEFIRISNLPEDQKEFIAASAPKDSIIMILKDNVILRDCIQYHHYLSLYDLFKSQVAIDQSPKNQFADAKGPSLYKFAFR